LKNFFSKCLKLFGRYFYLIQPGLCIIQRANECWEQPQKNSLLSLVGFFLNFAFYFLCIYLMFNGYAVSLFNDLKFIEAGGWPVLFDTGRSVPCFPIYFHLPLISVVKKSLRSFTVPPIRSTCSPPDLLFIF